jgi:hypothetical protein
MKIKSLYCGGGFIDSQLLWLIIVIDGYCNKNNIRNIIFERKLDKEILKKKKITRILKKYNIIYLKDSLMLKDYLQIFFFILSKFFIIIYYSSIINGKLLIKKNTSWEKNQIYHSIWDTSFFYIKDAKLSPNFIHKIRAAFRVYVNIYFAYKLKNIHTAFLGHSVYSARSLIAVLRKFKVRIFTHAGCVLNLLPKNYDISTSFVQKKNLIPKKNLNLKALSKKYWSERLQGRSTYEDSRIAFKSNTIAKYDEHPNIVMLHIFRDSPFNVIDRNRIFEDYISWLENTLEILKESHEEWLIRPHPNFKRWGEDSFKIYNQIYNKVFKNKFSKNIKYDPTQYSNFDLIKSARRIITFSGTSHVESACFGIKPIIISECTLSFLDKRLVFKPKTYSEYKSLILQNSNSNVFRLSRRQKEFSRKILFIKENILNLKADLKSNPIYRQDKIYLRKKEFNSISNNLNKKEIFLFKIGTLLGSKFKNTISEKYLKYYI